MNRCAWHILHCLVVMLAGHVSLAAQLPTSYRIDAGAYAWTGRLHAITFRTAPLAGPVQPVLSIWEAGRLLDQRDPASRRLYLGGPRMSALHWDAIDDAAREVLDVHRNGRQRIAWLRGGTGEAGMRPRDTRLGSSRGAHVLVVSPPPWQPLQAGHERFRQDHAHRAHTVWLGTRDGLVHGFDAASGQELAAYLPRAMLAQASALSDGSGTVPQPPCPRPDAVDAQVGGQWRTLLLCGIPSADVGTPATIFVLDISRPDGHTPLSQVWEVDGSEALPLTATGPVRAAALLERGIRRWHVVAIVDNGTHSGIALMPLDKQASVAGHQRLLPARGCVNTTKRSQLLATTVMADARGIASAIYASDNLGQLWRFPLDGANTDAPAVCVRRLPGPASKRAEAPLIIPGSGGPLVAVGGGSEVAVISTQGSPPLDVRAQRQGDGVLLRSDHQNQTGWTLTLPHEGEQFEQWLPAGPTHLGFTTLTPDGRQRSYLVDARSGSTYTVTGLPSPASAGTPIVSITPVATDGPTLPGSQRLDVEDIALWTIHGNAAHLLQHMRHARRRGRLSWRELTRTPI